MTQRATGCFWVVILAGITISCQTVLTEEQNRRWTVRPAGTLLSIDEMRNDAFTLHQQLRFSFAERVGKIDSVIQKNCDSLDVVGLGPFNTRIFTLQQVARAVEYEPKNLEKWPFPPLHILLDIHRVYLYPLPISPPPDGVYETEVADMLVTEHWKAGRLRQRILSSPAGQQPERIMIDYVGGLVRDEAPPFIVLEDERRQYRLELETLSFSTQECAKLGDRTDRLR